MPKLASGQCKKVDVAVQLVIPLKGRDPQSECQTNQYDREHVPLQLRRSPELHHANREHEDT